MALDLRQLECFIAVAEERNFGRAAQRLYMTQPPLTRRIKRLEADLGTLLFVRTAHGVEITAPGRVLLEQARRIIGLSERAVAITQAAQTGEVGELAVGYFGTVIFDTVPRLLSEFRQSHPAIHVRIDHLAKDEQLDAVRDGRIHVGFSRLFVDEPGLGILHIAEEPWLVALPEDHPLQHHAAIGVHDLEGHPMLLFPRAPRPSFADEVLHATAAAGFTASVAAEVPDAVTALAHVAVRTGLALVPRSAANLTLPGVRFVPLKDGPSERVSCVYRLDHQPPVLQTLLAHLQTVAA
jgi:DNA-binding transcriptional LysR family regulator